MDIQPADHPTSEILQAYSLGKLDDASAEAVMNHLVDCPECWRQVAEMSPDSFLGRLRDAQAGPETDRGSAEGSVLGAPSPGDSPIGTDETQPVAPHNPNGAGPQPGTFIRYFGDYELLSVLGEGGMGIVYEARQLSLNRSVALKMIQVARLASADDRRRLQNEAEAVARLDHPHIVPIFEVGQHDDQHYFSMKLISGASLDHRLRDYIADPRRAAQLMVLTAGAIHQAHQRGILHRDLKPANILIDAEGQPHVTDFGLAKRLEGDSELTRSGAIVGTPAYMAPEQTSGQRGAVTTATDVYGLGAVLYALLTGRAPFGGTTVLDTLDQVRERPPDPPRKLNPRVSRDLEVICLKCLEKDPRRRYASADSLVEELKRCLTGEPIVARPVGGAARFWMWARRNPVVAGACGFVTASLVVVAVLSLLYAGQQTRLAQAKTLYANEQRDRANERTAAAASLEKALCQSNRRLAMLNFERGHVAFESGRLGPGLLWTLKSLQNATDAVDPGWRHTALMNLSTWLPLYPRLRAVFSHSGPVRKVAYSPDGKIILTGSDDKTARLWDASTGQPIGQPMQHSNMVWSVAFSPDGKYVLTACGDKSARLWDAATGSPIGQPMVTLGNVINVAYSPDGKSVLTAGTAGQLWDVATGRPIGQPIKYSGLGAYSPDGKSVLTGSQDNGAWLWDAASGKPIGKPLTRQFSQTGSVRAVAYSPDGKIALTGGMEARLWDAVTGEPISQPLKHPSVESLAFSPDGKSILTGGGDKTARLWDTATGKPFGQPMVHQGAVLSVVFSPDGKTVLTGSWDGTARLWDAVTGRPIGQPLEHQNEVHAVAFSPDGKTVLTGSEDGTARLWDTALGLLIGKPLIEREGQRFAACSPDGKTILTTELFAARLWDATSGQPIGQPLKHQNSVDTVAFSPDGKIVLTASHDKTARLWDAATGQPIGNAMVHQGPVRHALFSPDGKTVLTGSDKTARLWNALTGNPLGQPLVHQRAVVSLAYSPDGKTVSTANDETVRLWDAATGRPVDHPMIHQGAVRFVLFSSDGKTMLTGSGDRAARLWDAVNGHPVGQSLDDQYTIFSVSYSPDCKTILTLSSSKAARLWDAATGQPIGQPMLHQGRVSSAVFSPDGRTVLTESLDSLARLWDAATGQPIGQPIHPTGGFRSAAFSPDGKIIFTNDSRYVRRWNVAALLPDDLRRLTALVETATGLELDEQGSIRLLDNAAWRKSRDTFSQVYGPPPDNTDLLVDPILFGLDPTARADGLRELARWNEAEAAYAEVERALPQRYETWIERAQFYLMRSEPRKAAADLEEANRLRPDLSWSGARLMLSLVAAGDFNGQRRACTNLLDLFGKTSDPSIANDVAWSLLLAPGVVTDRATPVALAERALKGSPTTLKGAVLNTLGAALYRAGLCEEAIRRLEEGIRLRNGDESPEDCVFLAMAHHRLGHRKEALRFLDRLRARQPSTERNQFWNELEIRLLRSEAEAVILYDPIFPADPFER